MKNEPELFPIQSLAFDPELQIRVEINEETIASYAEQMGSVEEMKKFPPVEVYYDGTKYWLADGHHRRAAAEMAGHDKVWAIIKSGTHADAIWAAILGNGKQGFGLTRADRNRATILAITYWPDKSNPVIADAVGCSRDTVRRLRESVSVSANASTETRTGKDGKQYKAKKTKKSSSTGSKANKQKDESETSETSTTVTSESTEQPSEQESQFRPGSLPTKKYVGETQLKPIPRDRPDILVANLIAFFPEEFVMNTAFEVFKMMYNRKGKSFIKPFALEIHKTYGRGK
jgi:hypothetical protein